MHVFEVCPNLNSNQIQTFKTDPSSTLVWYVCCAYLFEELYFDKQEAFNQEVPQSHTLAPANGAWHMQPVYYMYAHTFNIYIYIYITNLHCHEMQPRGVRSLRYSGAVKGLPKYITPRWAIGLSLTVGFYIYIYIYI